MSTVLIKGVETAEEQEAANDLMTSALSGYAHPVGRLACQLPEYLREHMRCCFWTAMVSPEFIYTYRPHGEARGHGGIGNVTTASGGNREAALLISDTMRYMKTRGYHLSMLFGIADFYHRWGFASVLPEYASVITLREADRATGPCIKERRMKPGDITAVLSLHNRGDADTSCSIIRSSAHFNNRWERWKEARILTDANGKVVASYLGRIAGEDYLIDELNATDTALFPAVLRACLNRARHEYAGRMRFNIPPSHAFAVFLTQYTTDHETHLYRNSNGMIASVNIEEVLECMTAEWESLLSASSMKDMAATVTLVIDNTPYRVRSHHGMIDVVPCPGENKFSISRLEFIQLISGYRHLEEIVASRRRALRAPAKSLLQVLFPKRTPYVWLLDRF